MACRENTETIAKQPKIDLRATLGFTLRNRPFLLLQSVTVILALGLGCEGVIGSYIHIYYTSQGSKTFGPMLQALVGRSPSSRLLQPCPLAYGSLLTQASGMAHSSAYSSR